MSQYQTEQATADMVAAEVTDKPHSVGGYRALAVVSFLIAVGGLFLGLLSKWVGFLAHSEILGAAGGVLDGSLIGFAIHYVKTIFDFGILNYLGDILYRPLNVADTAMLLSLLMTAVAAVLSLVFAIVSFCSRKAAKNCAIGSLTLVLLGYTGIFLTVFYAERLTIDGYMRSMFDIPTGIVAGVALICLVAAAFVRRKGLGFINLLLFVLTLLTVYSLCNRDSLFNQLTVLGGTAGLRENLFFGLSTLAFLFFLAFNFVASAARLNAKKSYLFDVFRFALLLVTALLSFLAHGLKTQWALFDTQMLSAILMLAAPLAALLLSLLVAIAKAAKARRAEAEEASKTIGTASGFAEQSAPAAQPAEQVASAPQPQPPFVSAFAQAQPAPAETAPDESAVNAAAFQPKNGETPMPQNVTVNVHPAPAMYGQQPMGMPFYPMPFYTAPAAESSAAKAAEPAPAPAAYEQNEPMSEFERSMAALAKGIAPEAENTSSAAYNPTPAPVYTPPVSFQSSPAATPASAPAPVYDAGQYTYDPFIKSLTQQEKNEFGDLFIANKFGDLAYLPAYVIGGDNREFFSKVFIYIGRYRSHISSALLDKLYVYVSRN